MSAWVTGLAVAAGLAALVEGRPRTGRTVVVEATVEASPAEVYRLFTTEEGTRSFFAPDSRIEAKVGGRYEMIFDPANDPEGTRAGTRGARVLELDAGRRVAFEWSVGVPGVSWDLKPTDFETWVEVTLEPAAGDPRRTRVRLAHEGFRAGGSWDTAYGYFERAWKSVLDNLEAYCREGRRPW